MPRPSLVVEAVGLPVCAHNMTYLTDYGYVLGFGPYSDRVQQSPQCVQDLTRLTTEVLQRTVCVGGWVVKVCVCVGVCAPQGEGLGLT